MRPYLIFASVGLSLFMYSIDSTAVAVAFPNSIRDFDTKVLWAAWTISIYSVTTIILHASATPAAGFRTTFLAFGLALLCTIPLVFLMPTGRQG